MRNLLFSAFVVFLLTLNSTFSSGPSDESSAEKLSDSQNLCAQIAAALVKKDDAAIVGLIQKKLWYRLREADLIFPILRNSTSAGAPQWVQSKGYPQTRETYEKYFPTVKLYAEIGVPNNGDPTFLDIHARFEPLSDTGLHGYYTKTMLSHVMSETGEGSRWSEIGMSALHNRYVSIMKNDAPDAKITEWDVVARTIWDGISDAEKLALVRQLLPDAARLVPYVIPPGEEKNYSEWSVAASKFLKQFRPSLERGEVRFGMHGEYAGLTARP